MLQPNPHKNLVIEINGKKYARYPVKTHLITPDDKDPVETICKYAKNIVQKDDIVFVSEKVIAVMQGRSYQIDEIKASKIATQLSKYVYRNPAGIGLAMPETMQLAIEEAGLLRILFAAFVAAMTKPFGIKGMFYRIAGDKARSIDGPVPYAIPPYNNYASKGPTNPKKIAENISAEINIPTAIVDANDLGVRILGASKGVDKKLLSKILKDNPLGQCDECTPIGIIREI
ncbi:coenzyme F420-0:L-glutamate ligase [Candidatus Parcubacteria bacterium]|nr:coenzyme F420-0:L-glutamate ligase [Candidatus Parcubacteria bacterium]